MSDEENLADQAGDDFVQPEVKEVEQAKVTTPEAADTTEGQDNDQPAEGEAESAQPEEKATKSQQRRERRKAHEVELRKQAAEAAERASNAERKAEELRKAASALQVPKQDDFDTFEEYQAALNAHVTIGRLKNEDAENLAASAKQEKSQADLIQNQQRQIAAENFTELADAAREKYDDFDKVALQDAPIDDRLAGMISPSDEAAEIAYHLGKNPQVALAMQQMSDVQAARELGRLEATLSAAKPKLTSTAPPPTTPVKSGSTSTKNPADMTPAEFSAWRDKGGTF